MKRVKSWLRVNAFVPPPAFFVFLDKINSRIDVLAGDSLLKVSSGGIGPTLVCVSRPTISVWRVVVCGLLRRCTQHCQTMVGASDVYCTIVRPA